jgi:predicted DCC family thiol-disulfide oxidoreductase YuxK
MHTQLTLFYDGYCPLCLAEMSKLREYDKQGLLSFVDIHETDFALHFPLLSWQELNARIHGQLADGRLISGLDVTYLAWKLVGKGWVYAPLRWPIIAWLADRAYLFFARYRYQISYLLTGKKRLDTTQNCATCVTKRK